MACAASATISGFREADMLDAPPSRFITAAVAIMVRGQRAFTAMPCGRSSSAIPRTHMLIPYFAMVYATCGANQRALMLSGGERFRMCGFFDFARYGMHACEHANVPRVFTWCMRS